MEAILRSSDIAVGSPANVRAGTRGSTRMGSSVMANRAVGSAIPAAISIPLRFMIFGLVSLSVAATLIVIRPALLATYHYNQYAVAVTHLMTLGFITPILIGAMYQLVPVALEAKLYSERLAKWQFAFHAVGVTGMVWMFWRWDLKQVGHFASVLAIGVGFFVYNIARTLCSVRRWNVVATAIASSLVWFSLTVVAGLALAAGKCSYELADKLPGTALTGALVHALKATAGFVGRFDQIAAMHAHAHLGGVGFFLLLLIGVSYRLVPMFSLSEVQNQGRARASVWLLNAGLAGSFVTILLRSPLKLFFALVIISAVTAYLWEVFAILRARRRQALDWGLRYFISALVVLGLCCGLAVDLAWPALKLNTHTGQLENLYGFLFLVGVTGFAILGMLYKIIPFLVWYGRYGHHIGRAKVPKLSELYSPHIQAAGYWSFLGGLTTTSAAILLGNEQAMPWCCGLLLLSLLLFVINMGNIFSHLLHPRLGAASLALASAHD
jgi:hypothetical protein